MGSDHWVPVAVGGDTGTVEIGGVVIGACTIGPSSMLGDSTLFARGDEVLASWNLVTPILDRWQETKPADFPNYQAGTWGPRESELLLATEGRSWRLI